MPPYHYTLNGPLLDITCSDSQQEHVDEERIPEVHDHPDGHDRVYVQQFNDSHLSKHWRKKLGKKLAIQFLFKSAGVDYTLTKFPKGYKLFSHVKGVNHEVDRTDGYLYGDDHKFRSPAEFLPHAAWLIAGMLPDRCRCKYCSPGRGKFSQRELNQQLDAGYREAKDKEKRKRELAKKKGKGYVPCAQPLEEVFLKTASGPGQVLRGFNYHYKVHSHHR